MDGAVRRAGSGDVETLFDIRTSVRENHQSRQELAALGVTPDSVVRMLATCCRAWIFERDGIPLGFAMADAAERTIFGLFVRPEAEGQGIGRILLGEAERSLFAGGAGEIWLTTGADPRLRAHTLYRAAGWIPAGQTADGQLRYEKRAAAPP